jgi:hypothetical protein
MRRKFSGLGQERREGVGAERLKLVDMNEERNPFFGGEVATTHGARTAPTSLQRTTRAGNPPLIVEPTRDHQIVLGHTDRKGLLVALAPLIEAVGHDEAPLASLPGVAERGLGSDGIGARIEGRVADLLILRPPRDDASPHRLGDALAVLRVGGDEHLAGRRNVPRRLLGSERAPSRVQTPHPSVSSRAPGAQLSTPRLLLAADSVRQDLFALVHGREHRIRHRVEVGDGRAPRLHSGMFSLCSHGSQGTGPFDF